MHVLLIQSSKLCFKASEQTDTQGHTSDFFSRGSCWREETMNDSMIDTLPPRCDCTAALQTGADKKLRHSQIYTV